MSEIPASRRLRHIRNAPLGLNDRDLLQIAEHWLQGGIGYPDLSCFGAVFREVDHTALELLNTVADLVSAIVNLQQVSREMAPTNEDVPQIHGAIRIYQAESQRLLAGLFPPDHPFWALFYQRQGTLSADAPDPVYLRQRQAMFCIPLDALHCLTGQKYQLGYELLLQSMAAAMSGFMRGGTHTTAGPAADYKRAMRLIRNYHLPCYDAWIARLMGGTTHHSNENQQL
ncbi:MAG: hypothetical protein R3301_17445 [Saprospiraceae bacterium]|nr:hypothetical protein [Saprospiraceae bacterium]